MPVDVDSLISIDHSFRALCDGNSAVSVALQGVQYTQSMPTGWKPPVHIRHATEDEHQEVRDKYHIITEGPNLLPPILAFKDMRLPHPILKQLESKGIKRPTPIQIQGLPIILAGRDMIGVAFTGSGKTLVFALPMIMLALQEEVRMSLERGEAPSWFSNPHAPLLNSCHTYSSSCLSSLHPFEPPSNMTQSCQRHNEGFVSMDW